MEENYEPIPINPSDLPIESVTLPTDGFAQVRLERVTVALKLDTSDHMYVSIRCTVVEPDDFEGLPIGRNYLALPIGVPDSAPKKVKNALQNHNRTFGLFARCFKIDKPMPTIKNLQDSEGRQAFHDFFEQFYGNVGTVTVEDNEFPKGSNRITSVIKEFIPA